MDLKEMLINLKTEAEKEIGSAEDLDMIEKIRVEFLGKKGKITSILREMGKIDADQRPVIGQLANLTREQIDILLASKKDNLLAVKEEKRLMEEKIDVTLPGRKKTVGRIHPLSKTIRRIEEVFLGMGYLIAEGPEVEYDRYNFEALNIPQDHPARDSQDTFYVTENILLRTHTSPVQIRYMENNSPPIKIISPGRVYRSDTVDATHSPTFHQIEGLVVDKGITMGDLIGTLREFAHGVLVRIRI